MSIKEKLQQLLADESVTDEAIRKALVENEDVRGNILTPDSIDAWLATEEGKKFIQPKLDKYHTKGLESFRQQGMQKELETLVNQRIKELYPDESPEGKKLRELEAKIEQSERERRLSDTKAVAITAANEKKLPSKLVDYILSEDSDKTLGRLEELGEVFSEAVEAQVKEKFKEAGDEIETGGGGGSEDNLDGMTMEQYIAHREKQGL